ncbi:unnamed protein product [Heligmosomoides polygyrus]|uniref:C-type lectin domain-containing protein n=1 Tax=Heligmosomoides polygyrus TaxID=6339 RepID=A0A183GA55_HELPZ|nr:unnamed protein product [Heligmosomoides polygyrus]
MRVQKPLMITDIETTWESAESVCQYLGGHLLSIQSDVENDYAARVLRAPSISKLYIGAYVGGGTWKWADNRKFAYSNFKVTTVDETWKKATDAIRHAAQSELGITKPGRSQFDKQASLWTDDVNAKVREKKSLYHAFLGKKTADNWQKYQEARNAAKKAVAVAKVTHYGDVNEKLESRDSERYLYRPTKNIIIVGGRGY